MENTIVEKWQLLNDYLIVQFWNNIYPPFGKGKIGYFISIKDRIASPIFQDKIRLNHWMEGYQVTKV